ncbi:Protein SEY1 [Smittium mucronatum]|uniref:Protein SEY1 n=1 Tax=Smittium mucronatum TaxID=133383 RepID=A0A1R0H4G1_9FUNG|nr:Protein SEY1 [Smittium mucronatum]
MIDDIDDTDSAIVPQMNDPSDGDFMSLQRDSRMNSASFNNELRVGKSAVSDRESQHENSKRTGREMLQIIDENQAFTPLMSLYMKNKWFLEDKGFDYNVVAVFGSQSTGKSTLLNSLFKTDFEELAKGKRQQTTRGIWCDCAQDMDVLVLDVEGTDGRERGEDQDFERKSALFSLAIAEVVIVNMWENMVGLYNGANMGLLKTVLEVNLQLFGKNRGSKTLLYFVIRDHVSSTPIEILGSTVSNDLERIWSELSKPGDLSNEKLFDHFDIKYTSLPHKLLQQSKFDEDVSALRREFSDPSCSKYVFKDIYKRSIPADGFSRYMESVWEKVVTNRDLDLPTQQELLAQYRCDEISASVLVPFRETVSRLRNTLEDGTIKSDLGSEMNNARITLISQFDEQASRYLNSVYTKKRIQLLNIVDTELHGLYLIQIKNTIDICAIEFETKAKALLDELNENTTITDFQFDINLLGEESMQSSLKDCFSSIIESQKKNSMSHLKNVIDSTKIEDCDWKFDGDFSNLESKIDTVSIRLRKSQLEKTITQTIDTFYDHFSNQISDIINEASPDMWEQILEVYVNGCKIIEKRLNVFISQLGVHGLGYNAADEPDYKKYLSMELDLANKKSRQLLFDCLLKVCREEFNENILILKLRTKFEEKFRYDSNNIPRIWNAADDIDGQYSIAKAESLKLLPLYASIDISGIQKNSLLKSTIGSPDYFYSPVEKDLVKTIVLKKYNMNSNLELLSEHKQREFSKRASREMDQLFLDSKRSVVSQSSQIPLWMIGLCVALGWNEAMTVLFNPIYLFLLLTIGTFVILVHNLGMWSPVLRIFRMASASATQTLHRVTVDVAKMVAETDRQEAFELGEIKTKPVGASHRNSSNSDQTKKRSNHKNVQSRRPTVEDDNEDSE